MPVYIPSSRGSGTSTGGGSAIITGAYTKAEADSLFVHKTGNETVGGVKNFTSGIRLNGSINQNELLTVDISGKVVGSEITKSDVLSISSQVVLITNNYTTNVQTHAVSAHLSAVDSYLQQQINQVASSEYVVFREQFTGNGTSKQFQLNGTITNAQFVSGGWNNTNVLNTLNSDITDLNNKPIYDAGILSIFTRHRIYVDSITGSSFVNLDFIPQNAQQFYVWYWYSLTDNDRIDNYYRDDYVAKMEENSGDLATNIVSNTLNFNNILSSLDITVQKSLETIDSKAILRSEVANVSASLSSITYAASANALAQAKTITYAASANALVQANSITSSVSANLQDQINSINVVGGYNIQVVESPTNTFSISLSSNNGFVPYTGATKSVDLGANALTTDQIFLNTSPISGAFKEGKIYYDNVNKSPIIQVDTQTDLNLGQHLVTRVYNNTGTIIPKGSACKIHANNNNNNNDRIEVSVAIAGGYPGTSFICSGGTTTFTLSNHGYSNGIICRINSSTNLTSVINGTYPIQNVTTNTFDILVGSGSISGTAHVILPNCVVGLATDDISASSYGFIKNKGLHTGIIPNSLEVGSILYLSDTIPGGYVGGTLGLQYDSRSNKVGYLVKVGSTSGQIYVDIENENLNGIITSIESAIVVANTISTGTYDFSGAKISVSDPTHKIDVPSCRGWIVNNTGTFATSPSIQNVIFPGQTNVTLTNLATADCTYFLINSSQNLIQQVTHPTPQERRDNIYLFKVTHPNRNTIFSIYENVDYDTSPASALRDMFTSIPLINDSITCYPNGANLNFNMTSGNLYGMGINWINNQKNPNQFSISATIPTSFYYRTQLGGSTVSISALIDPSHYDLGGVITALPGNTFQSTNQRIYLHSNGLVTIQYGQHLYKDLATALAAQQTEVFLKEQTLFDSAVLIGILAVRNGATTLNNIDHGIFTPASIFGESVGGVNGISTTTLQQAYNNSIQPEIVTNSTLGAVSFKHGSTLETDNIIEILNPDTIVSSINGLGHAFFASLSGSNNLVSHDISGGLTDSGVSTSQLTLLTTTASISANLQQQITNISTSTNAITSINGVGLSGNINLIGVGGIIISSDNTTKIITISGGSTVDLTPYTLLTTTSNISANLQSQITTEITDRTNADLLLTPLITTASISSQLSTLTYTASANLQAGINTKANVNHTQTASTITDFSEAVDDRINDLLVAGTNISFTYNDNANTFTINSTVAGGVSGSGLLQGILDCDTSNIVYTISHPIVDPNYSNPTISLLVPTSGSNLFVQGITNIKNDSFQVVLSEVPNISGYKIFWHLPSTSTAIFGTSVVNQQMTTLPSTTISTSSYTIDFTDTVVYVDNNSTVYLPSVPSTNEHHWIVNTYTSAIIIDGNGTNIIIDGVADTSTILPIDSSLHLHYNATKIKWYIL